jgi:hypothetical protein
MATEPAAAAFGSLIPFPVKKAAPPLEHWIMTGQLFFWAASKTALQTEELREKATNTKGGFKAKNKTSNDLRQNKQK